MVLNKGDERTLIMLIGLLLVSQIYLGTIVSVAADDAEHTYVLFQDDFEDGDAGDWTIDIPPDASPGSAWAVELDDSNYVLSESGQIWAEAGDFTWTNYTFEVKVKIITGSGTHINFRMSGSGIRYFFRFFSGHFTLEKDYMGTISRVCEAPGMTLNLNRWYTLRIVCIGKSIRVYVDDIQKLDYVDTDDPILSGRIGLESGPECHIYYDEVKVSTTQNLYVTHLLKEAQDEIYEARRVNADTGEAEQRLAEAQAAFAEGDLSSAESLAKETMNLAEHAPVGPTSVGELLKYSAEYDQHTVEVSGTIRDIRYEEGAYRFAVDDGTGVISATFNGTLGEIKTENKVKIIGVFDASTTTVIAEGLEKVKPPTEGLYTFLIFKDDFEDGDFSDWRTYVNPQVEGAVWRVEKDGDNYVLSGEGECLSETGDPDWTDYIFELKIKIIKGDANIQFRAHEKPPYGADSYILILSTRRTSSLMKAYIYLKEQRHTDLRYLDLNLNQNEWYNVKIICLENNIKIYLNDDLKLDHTDEDNPFLSGSIGLYVPLHDGDKPSHIYFDDVKVSRMATTSDIDDLITYAQSEIDDAREINADVATAELKLEQTKQALAQEEYQMVQYLVDETVWLAKRASIGQISIKDLQALATKMSGHTVIVTGTVKDLEARYGVGYDWALDDNTGRISVSYQGVLVDIGNEYKVKVTGVFDAPSETVTASRVEKISGPPAQQPSVSIGPIGITLSIEQLPLLISIGGAAVGIIGWFVRHSGMEKKRKILFKKLMEEVDDVYSRFKMNTRRCETELYKLKDEALDEFKEGMIDEDNYNILGRRIDDYMNEVKEQIEKEKLRESSL